MSRNVEIKAERRRRNDAALQGNRRRLAVNEAQLDRDNYEHRWVNDVGTRIFDLTHNDDWEVVTDRDGKARVDSAGIGAEIATKVDVDKGGAPIRAVLLRKPKAYFDEDYRAKQRAIDDQETLIGKQPTGGSDPHVYIKDGTRLSHEEKP